MEHETLFTASKWEILKQLEKGPSSPLQLSESCSTSIANVSQQLRLLEMAGLVTSERISNRDKGQPRILYSLAGNLSYLIATTGSFVDKKLLQLSKYNKIIMRIWFYPQKELHYTLEKAFWKIEDRLDSLDYIGVDCIATNQVTFCLGWQDTPQKLQPLDIKDSSGTVRQVVFSNEKTDGAYILYDPTGSAGDNKEKRGGKQ